MSKGFGASLYSLKPKESDMLNHKNVVSQGQDKYQENLEWIEREAEINQAMGLSQPRRKVPRESKLRWPMNMAQSIALLLIPGVVQEANR